MLELYWAYRGGGWTGISASVRASRRNYRTLVGWSGDIGFRCARRVR